MGQLDALHPSDYGVLIADWQREQEQCSKCGRPLAVCGDPETVWYPQRTVCYADMATARIRWEYEQLHGSDSYEQFHDGSFKVWSRSQTAGTPYGADDGLSLWVSTQDLSPDDHFLGDTPENSAP